MSRRAALQVLIMPTKQNLSVIMNSIPTDIVIPPQPTVLKQLHAEMGKEGSDAASMARLLCHDVAISATILKTVNSPYFGLKHKVQSIAHAISMLGIQPTIDLAAGFLLRKEFANKGIGFPRFWDSASNIADLCAFTAKKLELAPSDLAFTLGLFHDVGIPIMAQQYPNYLDVLKQANEAKSGLFTDAEDSAYQVDHAIIACAITHQWGISDSIRDIILYHHEVEDFYYFDQSADKEQSKLLSILKVAELGNSILRTGTPDHDWVRFGDIITNFLGITEDDIYGLIKEFKCV